MKTSIRHSVFETNSSSSHSITIVSGNRVDLFDVHDGDVIATGDEFGWGIETHDDQDTKFQYLITHLFGKIRSDDDINEIVENNSQFKMLKEVMYKYCGVGIKVPNYKTARGGDNYYPFGYIDHSSWGEANEAFKSKDTLADFLFNPQSELLIDNDNH